MASRKHTFNPERRVSLRSVVNNPKKIDKMIRAIEKNPAVRYIVTDDAGNEAVLMSPQTYEFLKKVVEKLLANQVARAREERIAQAVGLIQHDLIAPPTSTKKQLPVELL